MRGDDRFTLGRLDKFAAAVRAAGNHRIRIDGMVGVVN
jgi:hypothetical protein